MIDWRGVLKALVSIAMVPVISGLGLAAGGQELFAQEPVERVVQRGARTEEQFDGRVDQIVRSINDRDSADGGRLSERLALELDRIEATCKTSEAQRKKLRIAGLGDIKRFLDEMREMKRRYRRVKGDAEGLSRIQQELGVIENASGAALFGNSSLLAKTLRMTLSAEQAAAMERADEQSRAFARRTAIEQAVYVCDIAVGLKDEQRRKLTEFFVVETRQTKGDQSAGLAVEVSTILTTAKTSRDKFKAMFDEQQWRRMSELLKEVEPGGNAVGVRGGLLNGVVDFVNIDVFADELLIVPGLPGVPAGAQKE